MMFGRPRSKSPSSLTPKLEASPEEGNRSRRLAERLSSWKNNLSRPRLQQFMESPGRRRRNRDHIPLASSASESSTKPGGTIKTSISPSETGGSNHSPIPTPPATPEASPASLASSKRVRRPSKPNQKASSAQGSTPELQQSAQKVKRKKTPVVKRKKKKPPKSNKDSRGVMAVSECSDSSIGTDGPLDGNSSSKSLPAVPALSRTEVRDEMDNSSSTIHSTGTRRSTRSTKGSRSKKSTTKKKDGDEDVATPTQRKKKKKLIRKGSDVSDTEKSPSMASSKKKASPKKKAGKIKKKKTKKKVLPETDPTQDVLDFADAAIASSKAEKLKEKEVDPSQDGKTLEVMNDSFGSFSLAANKSVGSIKSEASFLEKSGHSRSRHSRSRHSRSTRRDRSDGRQRLDSKSTRGTTEVTVAVTDPAANDAMSIESIGDFSKPEADVQLGMFIDSQQGFDPFEGLDDLDDEICSLNSGFNGGSGERAASLDISDVPAASSTQGSKSTHGDRLRVSSEHARKATITADSGDWVTFGSRSYHERGSNSFGKRVETDRLNRSYHGFHSRRTAEHNPSKKKSTSNSARNRLWNSMKEFSDFKGDDLSTDASFDMSTVSGHSRSSSSRGRVAKNRRKTKINGWSTPVSSTDHWSSRDQKRTTDEFISFLESHLDDSTPSSLRHSYHGLRSTPIVLSRTSNRGRHSEMDKSWSSAGALNFRHDLNEFEDADFSPRMENEDVDNKKDTAAETVGQAESGANGTKSATGRPQLPTGSAPQRNGSAKSTFSQEVDNNSTFSNNSADEKEATHENPFEIVQMTPRTEARYLTKKRLQGLGTGRRSSLPL